MANPPANLPFEPVSPAQTPKNDVPPTGGMAPSPRPTPPPAPPPPVPPPAAVNAAPPAPQKPAQREPEDIFSNIEQAAKKGPTIQAGGPGPDSGPMPHESGALKTFAAILLVILVVVGIGGGLFWYFVLRTPVETGTIREIPTVKTNEAPIPTGAVPAPPSNSGISPTPTAPTPAVVPTPVTQPPAGTNVPPPTPVTSAPPVPEPEPVDTDGDELTDSREAELGLDPNNADTDGDELSDGEEVLIYRTNPTVPDTDGDGFTDAGEIRNGYNPLGSGKCTTSNCIP